MRQANPERWFVSCQGITLGPLSTEAVLNRLRKGQLLSEDKVCFQGQSEWSKLDTHPHFAAVANQWKSASRLQPPLPPSVLRRRPIMQTPATSALPRKPMDESERISPESSSAAAIPVGPVPFAPERPLASEWIPQSYELNSPPKEEPKLSSTLAPAEEVFESAAAPEERSERLEPNRAPPQTTVESQPKKEPIPPRPDYEPIFIAEPSSRRDESLRPPSPRTVIRPVIKIELKVPENIWRMAPIFVLVALLAFFAGRMLDQGTAENKTRDLKDFHLPDPSSPTTAPLETGDPNPSLKAPTRPQRE